MAAGAALAAKRGERSKASLKGASREMVETMSEQQLREFASTKRGACRASAADDRAAMRRRPCEREPHRAFAARRRLRRPSTHLAHLHPAGLRKMSKYSRP